MKKRPLLILSLAVAGAAALAFVSAGPATAGPDFPCPTCAYDVSEAKLTGTLDANYTQHPYPFTGLSITLNSNSAGVLDTVDDLPPTFQYGSTVLNQTIDTDVSSGVDMVELSWTDDNGNPLSQSITVVP